MKMTLRFLAMASVLLAFTSAHAQCPSGQTQVSVSILLDNYPAETTWSLALAGCGAPLASGGPYTAANSTQTGNACVADGAAVVFTINDSYGDGICCGFGNGSYTVTANGNTVATGGDFDFTESTYFQTIPAVSLDLAPLTLGVPSVIAQGNQSITGTLRNMGTTAITGFTLSYSIDGGAPVSAPITAAVAANSNYTFTHPTPWNATVGEHTVTISVSAPNGGTDGNAVNDEITCSVNVASQTVQRKALMEQFTSSTCPPCASLETSWGIPTFAAANPNSPSSNIAAIKYHLNFPSPGNDPSYNPDAAARRTYYGVNAIPNRFMDGVNFNNNTAAFLTNAAARPAFVDIAVSYTVAGFSLTANVTVTPYATFPGAHKLYIGVLEDTYNYAASTTSQDVFKYVMRKMMPNGGGITLADLVAGTPQTFTQSYTFAGPPVAQGGYNLWTTLDNSSLLAFVQNTASKDVLQSNVVNIVAPVGIDEVNALDRHLTLFPNPTDGLMSLSFDLPSATSVSFSVLNLVGEQVMSSTRGFGSGEQRHNLDLSALANGSYLVQVTADGLTATRKVTVSH